jgi:hypothetical protein
MASRWKTTDGGSQESRHGPHIARTEVISLTTFDGPLTVA